jgi:hypothetical protein
MVLQVVILFGFQVLHGVVVAEVSLIVTVFLDGLALGGTASNLLIQLETSNGIFTPYKLDQRLIEFLW